MTVRSQFPQECARRLATAALVVWLLVPAAAGAQQPAEEPGKPVDGPASLIDGPRPATIEGPAADRMVAEWMLRMGGSIVLEGQRKPITDLADLPATDFRIHALNFTGITMYAASLQDELRKLPPLPHLKELYVNGRLWYDQPAPRVQATIALFSQATELEKFVMSKPVQTYIPFNDPALKGLTTLSSLKEVRIHQTRSSGMSLGAFPLTHLDLNYAVTFNDTGMASLKGKTTLQRLYLRGTSITDVGVQYLSDLTNLVELDLSDIDDDRRRAVSVVRAHEAAAPEPAERRRNGRRHRRTEEHDRARRAQPVPDEGDQRRSRETIRAEESAKRRPAL